MVLSHVLLFVLSQELTPEAKASPYAEQWLWWRGPAGMPGDLYQGTKPVPGAATRNRMIDGGDEWVGAFSVVPKAHELAKSARTLQRVALATWWSSLGMTAVIAGIALVVPRVGGGSVFSSPGPAAAVIGGAALTGVLLAVATLTGARWQRLVEEAVREYNMALNETLPEGQRFDVGG